MKQSHWLLCVVKTGAIIGDGDRKRSLILLIGAVSICQAKRHFLSLKLNVISSYFAGTACDNFGAKKLQYVANSCFFGECVA